MAKNWKASEAFVALHSEKTTKEDRIDIARRFPLFATATAEEIIAALPDYLSARKVEATLKGDVEINEDGEEEVETPVKKEAPKKAKKVVEEDDDDEDEDEAPKKKAPKKAKKVVVDDDEDDDDDDDDDEDEAPKKKPAKKAKKVVVDDDDDDDDF